MENNVRILLLKIIKFNGSIIPLVSLGYEYSQIAQMIKAEILDGNAHRVNGKLTVTDKGNSQITSLNKELKRENSTLWIEPEIESKISRISTNDIFLPSQNELSF
jgi:hypothetical protein